MSCTNRPLLPNCTDVISVFAPDAAAPAGHQHHLAAQEPEHLGRAVARLVLYGSRARGDARAGSDYDVAVFLKPFRGVGVEVETLSRVAWDIERDTGAVLSLLPFPADAYRARTLPMRAIRSEGVAL